MKDTETSRQMESQMFEESGSSNISVRSYDG